MPRKGVYRPKVPIGDAADPESLWNYLQRFSQWQLEKNYSPKTVEGREVSLGYFIAWCAERGLMRPQEITKPILERYQRHLFLRRKKDGEPLSARTQIAFTTPDPGLLQVALQGQPHPLQPGLRAGDAAPGAAPAASHPDRAGGGENPRRT
jgi:hypothetical protein